MVADHGFDQMAAQFLIGLVQGGFQLRQEAVHLVAVGAGGKFHHGAQLVAIHRREEGELEPAGGDQAQRQNESGHGGDADQMAVADGPGHQWPEAFFAQSVETRVDAFA